MSDLSDSGGVGDGGGVRCDSGFRRRLWISSLRAYNLFLSIYLHANSFYLRNIFLYTITYLDLLCLLGSYNAQSHHISLILFRLVSTSHLSRVFRGLVH